VQCNTWQRVAQLVDLGERLPDHECMLVYADGPCVRCCCIGLAAALVYCICTHGIMAASLCSCCADLRPPVHADCCKLRADIWHSFASMFSFMVSHKVPCNEGMLLVHMYKHLLHHAAQG
jgi:hypothetical protein